MNKPLETHKIYKSKYFFTLDCYIKAFVSVKNVIKF